MRTCANCEVNQQGDEMTETKRLSVLLEEKLAVDFEAFCQENSHKKSTFVAHLIREFLRKEGYPKQTRLL